MKNLILYENFDPLDEGSNKPDPKVVELRQRYRELWSDLESEHFEAYLNYDDSVGSIGSLLGDKEGLEAEFEKYLIKKKAQDKPWDHTHDFLNQSSIKGKAVKALKDRENKIDKELDSIQKKLASMYPSFKSLDNELESYSGGPVLGTEIYKKGKLWSITTPGYYNDDIDITPEEVADYKKYLKDSGIKKAKKRKPSYPKYD